MGYAQNSREASSERQAALLLHPTSATFLKSAATDASHQSNEFSSNDLTAWISPSERLITLFPHRLDDRGAITLYVRSIPVMTFLGSDLPVAEGTKSLIADQLVMHEPDLVARAIATATHLDRFRQALGEAADIRVRWNDSQDNYLVSLAEVGLITIDETTIYPHPTQDPAKDALEITNRLRYLMGEAPPLEKVEGLPQPPPPEPAIPVAAPRVATVLTGVASWYGPGFHGRRSASGEIYNQHAMTAAHRSLPFGTQVRVTNLNNGHQVVVRINDRGPFIPGRVIDLSAGAATALGMTYSGLAQVRIEVLAN